MSPRRLLALLLLMPASATAQNAPRFSKPSPEKVFAELKVERAGEVLRAPIEDWEGARRRVRDDAAWREWLDKEKREVDEWMSKRSDRVEWIAGWYHDFVSPKNAARLRWTPDEPGENTLTSTADPNEKVALTPKLHAAWVYQFRTTHGDFMLRAAQLFRLTGDEKYGAWAASQLDFYADNLNKWPEQQRTKGVRTRLMHQTLDEAVTLVTHVNTAMALGSYATPERRQKWSEGLFRPLASNLSKSMLTIHNIATWHRAAQAHAALFANDAEGWKQAIDGKWGIREQLREGVTGDYLWFEQSLGYNSYVVLALLSLFTNASLTERAAELRDEMHIAQNLALAPIAIRFPDGRLPTPADSSRLRAPDRALLRRIYRLFPTPIGIEEAQKEKSWATLIDPPQVLAGAPQVLGGDGLPPVTTRSLESSRMALLRSGPWQLWFHYGQVNPSHSQAEALNFEAFWNTIDITHDAGTVGYGSPLHRDFYTRGPAHNALLIDGEGQAKWNPGQLIKFDAAQNMVEAEQPEFRPNARARRALRIQDGALIDEARITATDGKPHALGLTLQVQGSLVEDAAQQWKPAPDFAKDRPAAFKYWQDARTMDAPADGRLALAFRFDNPDAKGEKKTFRVMLAVPPGSRVFLASVPDAPPQRRTALLVELQGTEASFRTEIAPV